MLPYCVLWGSNPRHHIPSPSAAYPSASAPHAWCPSTSDTVSSDLVLNNHRCRQSRIKILHFGSTLPGPFRTLPPQHGATRDAASALLLPPLTITPSPAAAIHTRLSMCTLP